MLHRKNRHDTHRHDTHQHTHHHNTHTAASDIRRIASDSGQVLPLAMAVLLIVALFLTGESLVLFAKSRETRQRHAEALAVDTVDAAVAHINNIVATYHKIDDVVKALIPYAQHWRKFTGHNGCADDNQDDPSNNTWVAKADMCWRIHVSTMSVNDPESFKKLKQHILKTIKNRTGQDVQVIELNLDVKAGCQIDIDVLPDVGETSVDPFAPRCDTSDTIKLRYAQSSFLNYLIHYDEPKTPPDPDAAPPEPGEPQPPGRWGPPAERLASFHYLDSINGPIHTNKSKVHICAQQTNPDGSGDQWEADEKVKDIFSFGEDSSNLYIEVVTGAGDTPHYLDQCNPGDAGGVEYSASASAPNKLDKALAPKASPKLDVYYPAADAAKKKAEGVTCSNTEWLAAAEQQMKAGTPGWVDTTAVDPADPPQTVGYVQGWVGTKPEPPSEGNANLLDIQIKTVTDASGQTRPHVKFVAQQPRQAPLPDTNTNPPIQVVWSEGDLVIPVEGVFEQSITFIAKKNIILEASADTLMPEALPAIYDQDTHTKLPGIPDPYASPLPGTGVVNDVLLKGWVGSKMGTSKPKQKPSVQEQNQAPPPVLTFIAGCDVFITFKRPIGYIHPSEDDLTPDTAQSLAASEYATRPDPLPVDFHEYVRTVAFLDEDSNRKDDLLNKIIREIAVLDTIAEQEAATKMTPPPEAPILNWKGVADADDPLTNIVLNSESPNQVEEILKVVARCLQEPPRMAPPSEAHTEPADPHANVSAGVYKRMQYDSDFRRLCSFMSVALENVAILAPAGGIKAGASNVKHGDWEICHYPCRIIDGSAIEASSVDIGKKKLAYAHLPAISIKGSIATRYRGLLGQYYKPPPPELPAVETTEIATGYRKIFSYPENFAKAEPSWWPDIQTDKWVPVAIPGEPTGS